MTELKEVRVPDIGDFKDVPIIEIIELRSRYVLEITNGKYLLRCLNKNSRTTNRTSSANTRKPRRALMCPTAIRTDWRRYGLDSRKIRKAGSLPPTEGRRADIWVGPDDIRW
jgi:hypothetical protein